MTITTDAGITLDFNDIDTAYARTIITSMLDIILNRNIFRQDAKKELERVEHNIEKAMCQANLYADRWGDQFTTEIEFENGDIIHTA